MILGAAIGIGADLWQAVMPSVNPPAAAAEWQLSSPADCGNPLKAEIQSWPGTSGARRVCRATYVGPSKVQLTVFDMPEWAGATAFGVFQRWLSSGPGTMGFLKGRYFGVVDSPDLDHAAMERFRMAIENALPGKSESHWYRMSPSSAVGAA